MGFEGTHSLRLVPVSAPKGKEENGGKYVFVGEGKASRFRSASAKQAVTLR